jgi:two-component system, OmpR family, response regulator
LFGATVECDTGISTSLIFRSNDMALLQQDDGDIITELGVDPERYLLKTGPLTLDYRDRVCLLHAEHRAVQLSGVEFKLLECLMRNAGKPVARDVLWANVWKLDRDPRSNRIEVYITYLRTKLGSSLISTVRGLGYRFNAA